MKRQPLGNRIFAAVLRSRVHGLLSRSLILLEIPGRRTGRIYPVPVQFVEHDGNLIAWPARPATKTWWRNLRGGAAITVYHRGRRRAASAEAISGDPDRVGPAVAAWLRRFPRTARMLGLDTDPAGLTDTVVVEIRPED